MRIAILAATAALLAACAATETPAPVALPAAAETLVGGEWIQATRALRAPTISFAEDGGAAGFAGCNRWFAQVTREGESLRFSTIGATRMACEPPLMTMESNFLGMLEHTRAARQEGGSLYLLDETGAVIATFLRNN